MISVDTGKLQVDLKMTWKGSRDPGFLTAARKRCAAGTARNRKHCSTVPISEGTPRVPKWRLRQDVVSAVAPGRGTS